MVRFGFNDYEVEFNSWAKHHKVAGVHVKRVYNDGKEVLPKDESLKKLIKEYEDVLKEKRVILYDKKTFEKKEATDYYLPVKNLEYQEADIEYYSVGASNTNQTTYIRLVFLIEYDKFVLDYESKSRGSFAPNFYDMINYSGAIEDIIEEIVEEEKPIEEVGIRTSDEPDYYDIVVVSTIDGSADDIQISKRDLVNSLVGIEIYKFEQEIE